MAFDDDGGDDDGKDVKTMHEHQAKDVPSVETSLEIESFIRKSRFYGAERTQLLTVSVIGVFGAEEDGDNVGDDVLPLTNWC